MRKYISPEPFSVYKSTMQADRRELQGWDQIADYLGVRKRAAQNYEKDHGLPVRRLPGEKGRVWARSEELDAWKQKLAPLPDDNNRQNATGHSPFAISTTPEQVDETKVISPRPLRWRIPVAALCFVVAGAVFWWSFSHPTPPTDFRMEAEEIVALGPGAKELWRYHFPQPVATALYGDHPGPTWISTENLDDDGAKTLFRYAPYNWITGGGALYCFSPDGKVRWRFTPGKKVMDASGQVYETYSAGPFRVLAPSTVHKARVVISSPHTLSYPDQVAVLGGHGEMLGEYWHSGHILYMATADLDGDGVEEIILAGVNNGYKSATLIILDPRRVGGASAQGPGDNLQLQSFGPGTEKLIVRFPRTCITDLLEPYNRVGELVVTKSTIEVLVAESYKIGGTYLIYRFDYRMNLTGLIVSDSFLNRHRELESTGQLNHSFSPAEKAGLERQVKIIRR